MGIDTIVTVKAPGDQEKLAATLEVGVPGVSASRLTDKGIELHVSAGDRLLARVVSAADDGGYHVADLAVAEPSLETVFISLTGKELRDA